MPLGRNGLCGARQGTARVANASVHERGLGMRGHAEIAGAGLGGLSAALALSNCGWTVRVHEQGQDLREFGAGVFLWENVLHAFDALGVLEEVMDRGRLCVRHEILDDRHAVLKSVAFPPSRRQVCIRRNDLYKILLDRAIDAGAEFQTGSRAAGAGADGTLHFADGKTLRADLVVGSDGVHSVVRESLRLTRRHRTRASGAIRLLASQTDEDRRSIADAGGAVTRHYLGLHQRRVLYSACSADEVYIALGTTVGDTVGRAIPVDKASWLRWFPGLGDIFDRVGVNGRWDRYEEVVVRSWFRGRVALVGDAAHAMQPHLGQGACLAVANSVALATCLAAAENVDVGLADWERRARPLTDHAQRWSNWKGKVTQDELRVPRPVRSFAARSMETWPFFVREINKVADSTPVGVGG